MNLYLILIAKTNKQKFFKDIFHLALFRENLEVAKLLIEKGANINAKDNNGMTLLDLAKFA